MYFNTQDKLRLEQIKKLNETEIKQLQTLYLDKCEKHLTFIKGFCIGAIVVFGILIIGTIVLYLRMNNL